MGKPSHTGKALRLLIHFLGHLSLKLELLDDSEKTLDFYLSKHGISEFYAFCSHIKRHIQDHYHKLACQKHSKITKTKSKSKFPVPKMIFMNSFHFNCPDYNSFKCWNTHIHRPGNSNDDLPFYEIKTSPV